MKEEEAESFTCHLLFTSHLVLLKSIKVRVEEEVTDLGEGKGVLSISMERAVSFPWPPSFTSHLSRHLDSISSKAA